MSTAGFTCEFCQGQHPVRYLFTSLANGETLVMCEDDTPVALIPLLAGHLGVDTGRLYDTVKRFVDREAKAEAKRTEDTAAVPEAAAGDPELQGLDDDGLDRDGTPEGGPGYPTAEDYLRAGPA